MFPHISFKWDLGARKHWRMKASLQRAVVSLSALARGSWDMGVSGPSPESPPRMSQSRGDLSSPAVFPRHGAGLFRGNGLASGLKR